MTYRLTDDMQLNSILSQRDIYTVSRLNREVRAVLEGSFPLLWVEGEISNLARPSSGHIYFSLKDEYAQVRCAMFRMKRQRLRFEPENGLQVLVRARVGLYEGRGEFQLVVEHMEPSGEGALLQAFERLKQKLAGEGLFDAAHKRPLPRLPRRIGIITSPSGAAIRDVLSVLERRFPAIPVLVYPVQVQGEQAAAQLIRALALANERADCDVLILARGGGSLEDLMPFNDESLARAVFDSALPVVSGVGHEIDFTIADFVADRRAATPSAAAELVSPDREALQKGLTALAQRATRSLTHGLHGWRNRLDNLQFRLIRLHPGQVLVQQQQRLDEIEQRLLLANSAKRRELQARIQTLDAHLRALSPVHRLETQKLLVDSQRHRLIRGLEMRLTNCRQRLARAAQGLDTLSPLSTLHRGYSITLLLPDEKLLRDAQDVKPGDRLETRLESGVVLSRVEESIPNPNPT